MALVCGLLIASVIPLTLSRTGILAVLATFLVMLPLWSWRLRFNLVALAFGLVALAILARPRLMGTLRSLFTDWESDNSIQGRTNRYDAVFEYVRERPLLGRGPGTFLPDQYLLLDNQWLATLVSNGVVGVIGLVIVHGVAAALAVATIRHATTPQDRHLAGCLLAAQVIAVIAAGTFDSFAFTTFTTTIAICTGLAAALWRLSHPRRSFRTASSRLGRT
jgi:polysaccharide biosynthesis protein PslJ